MTNNNSKNEEIKFVPYYTGKQQMVTYDTVKEHVIQQIQKSFKYGSDMVKLIRDRQYGTIGAGKPVRQLAATGNGRDDIKIEQDGYDLEYTENLPNYNTRLYTHKENKHKAYSLIFGYCNKIMQNRIEEISDFETRVRNDPLVLLEEIKTKMYDPS